MGLVLGFLLSLAVSTAITWVLLMIVIPIAQKLADFSMPPWPENGWKLAVVAAGVNAVTLALSPINGWLGLIAGAIVFFTLMVKWFDVDFFGAMIIVGVTWIIRSILAFIITAALLTALR